MARLPNTATKSEREELHKAKMAGKVYDRNRRFPERFNFTSWRGSRSALKRLVGYGSIARANRHTGKPHEHLAERSRHGITISSRAPEQVVGG